MSGKKIIPIIGIPGLVGIMAVALLALLGVQWYWVTHAVSLKEEQFDRQVTDALNRVVERLQDSETAHFITSDIRGGEFPADLWVEEEQLHSVRDHKQIRVIKEQHVSGPGGSQENVEIKVVQIGKPDSGKVEMAYQYSYSSDGEVVVEGNTNHSVVIMEADSLEDVDRNIVVINGDTTVNEDVVLAEKNGEKYIQMMVRRLLHTTGPIEDRVRNGQIDSLIAAELAGKGITDNYLFEIVRQPMRVTPVGMVQVNQDFVPDGAYAARLFPRDLNPSLDHLLVTFPDRQTGTVRAMGLLLPTSGVLVLVVVLCFGLTLYALQRQKKLSEMKTDFINNMTHELKTPISTISLALQALNDPDMHTEDSIVRFTGIIGEENERLRGHVERVLQAATLEREGLQLNLEEVDAHELISDAVARMQLYVTDRQGTIQLKAGANHAIVQADAVHFSGIVDNLLDNAVKYSTDAPQISLETRNVDGGFEFSVSDKGRGMSREVQKRIFEKFYREPRGDVHDVKGFGLGLSYVQAMVQAHNGRISVESEPGKGSRFIIFIPQLST
jgi:two-component system phosphate regulon sensor histidine kinase PhoR